MRAAGLRLLQDFPEVYPQGGAIEDDTLLFSPQAVEAHLGEPSADLLQGLSQRGPGALLARFAPQQAHEPLPRLLAGVA